MLIGAISVADYADRPTRTQSEVETFPQSDP